MKQTYQQISKGLMVLLVLLSTVTIISAKESLFNKKNNEEGGTLENVLMQKLKTIPTFAQYFKTAKNPNLTGLLKTQRVAPKIDSMVSAVYDTSFQKVKNSFQYDANGYMSNFLIEYFKGDLEIYGESFSLDVRADGQLNSFLRMVFRNGVWVNKNKETYTYDPSSNQIASVSEKWDTSSSNWIYNLKHDYTYNSNHKKLSDTEAQWNSSSSSWENSYKYEWNYDANNDRAYEVSFNWIGGVWKNFRKTEWAYTDHKKTSQISSVWQSGAWKNDYKETYTYDGSGNLISKNEFKWNSTSSSWDNNSWTLYTYNTNNKLTFQNEKRWDTSTSTWIDNSRETRTYNENGKLTELLDEDYDGSAWANDFLSILVYNENGRVVSYIEKNDWNGSDWDNNDKYNFRYNSLGLCNGGSHETWFSSHWVSADAPWAMFMPKLFYFFFNDFDDDYEFTVLDELTFYSSYIPGYEYSVYYQGITGIKEKTNTPTKFTLSQNYPNPFNPSTKISYSLPSASHVTLKIFDILGNEITTLVDKNQSSGKYNVTFNASNLTSGIYFYQINTSKFSKVHKMILMK